MKLLEGSLAIASVAFDEAEKNLKKALDRRSEEAKSAYIKTQKLVSEQYPFILGIGHEQVRVFCDGDTRAYEIPAIYFLVDKNVIPKESGLFDKPDPKMANRWHKYGRELSLELFQSYDLLREPIDGGNNEEEILASDVLGGMIPLDEIDDITNAIYKIVASESTEQIWDSGSIVFCKDGVFKSVESRVNYG